MTELQANFSLEPQQPINASFELGDPTPIEATLSLNVTNTEHDKLTNRDLPDQHPMTAITGLVDALAAKQDTLVAGLNVQINGNVISATDTTYTAGTGISIVGNVISNTQTSAEWGNITGTLSAQTDLQNALNAKANTADIPTATSDLTNDSGFITLSALTPYATQTWVENKGYLTEIPAEYVTDSELTAKGYQTAVDVETAITAKGYTTMSAVEAKGYITNAALVGYVTESWVTQQGYITSSALTPYVLSADLATVATSGSYDDLSNKPTIPAAQVNSDWNATSGVAQILNKPSIPTDTSDLTNGAGFITGITSSDVTTALGYTPYNASNPNGYITSAALTPYALSANLATVATSGSYNDLSNTPTIPTVNNATITITQGGTTKGTFTLNQASNETIALDAGGGGGGTTYTAGDGIDITNNVISVDNTIALKSEIPTNNNQLSNGAGYITSAALTGYATESYVTTATANMQTTGNLVTSITSTSTNAQYPSAKCVYDIVGDIESAINMIRGV